MSQKEIPREIAAGLKTTGLNDDASDQSGIFSELGKAKHPPPPASTPSKKSWLWN